MGSIRNHRGDDEVWGMKMLLKRSMHELDEFPPRINHSFGENKPVGLTLLVLREGGQRLTRPFVNSFAYFAVDRCAGISSCLRKKYLFKTSLFLGLFDFSWCRH